MAIIEGIRIRNYRVLKDVTLGRLEDTPDIAPLTPMTAVIGKNGVGKSSLFDAFGFLADCLKLGVEQACYERGRGGFDRIRSRVVVLSLGSKFVIEEMSRYSLSIMNSLLARTNSIDPSCFMKYCTSNMVANHTISCFSSLAKE